MSCLDSCLHCLSLVPWASLIALVLCWAGTALFSGALHAALTNTASILNESSITTDHIAEQSQNLKYSIYGISAFVFVLTILLFVDGLMTTRAVKNDYDAGCKSTCWGLLSGIVLTILTYVSGLGWIVLTCASTLPVHFFIVLRSQCRGLENLPDSSTDIDKFCVYFDQTGVVAPGTQAQICGNELEKFCNDENVGLTEQLYLISFIGAVAALVSMMQFLMSLSANLAYSKMIKKLSVYEDAKYREEMELNDIINTARSNERLTYNKY